MNDNKIKFHKKTAFHSFFRRYIFLKTTDVTPGFVSVKRKIGKR